jgi:hypothetical protein
MPIPLADRAAQAEGLLTELNRDGLADWWGRLQDAATVPLWVVQAKQGLDYPG